VGEVLTGRGWHSTGVFGRIASAAAAAALAGLDKGSVRMRSRWP
jgi:2-methylcitrate dehydratase PrpD